MSTPERECFSFIHLSAFTYGAKMVHMKRRVFLLFLAVFAFLVPASLYSLDFTVEVWNVPDRGYVTELSFSGDSVKAAAPLRDELIGLFDGLGILVHKSSLKTNMILDSFLN